MHVCVRVWMVGMFVVWSRPGVQAGVVKHLSVDHAGSAGSNGVHRSPRHDKATVCFGNTAQDILSTLGAPSKVFYKAEDKVGSLPASQGSTLHTKPLALLCCR